MTEFRGVFIAAHAFNADPGFFRKLAGNIKVPKRHNRKDRNMRVRAKISKWVIDRGFGFARSDDRDFFVHCSQLPDGRKALDVGDEIEFETVPDKKDPSRHRAVAVSLLS
jgi:cold shock CspA family protein